MNFSRGNISNTRKALTEKNGIWNVSIMASAREVPDSNWHISSSTNSGYREQKWSFGQDFSLSVSSFDVVSKIGFVMFVQYPQWNFLSYWKWPIINFWICHHKTHCIDLRWSFDKKWQKRTPFAAQNTLIQNCVVIVENIYQPRRHHFGSFQRATIIYVEPPKTRAKKYKWPRLFKNGCHWNTNGNENLHVPAAWPCISSKILGLRTFQRFPWVFFPLNAKCACNNGK